MQHSLKLCKSLRPAPYDKQILTIACHYEERSDRTPGWLLLPLRGNSPPGNPFPSPVFGRFVNRPYGFNPYFCLILTNPLFYFFFRRRSKAAAAAKTAAEMPIQRPTLGASGSAGLGWVGGAVGAPVVGWVGSVGWVAGSVGGWVGCTGSSTGSETVSPLGS